MRYILAISAILILAGCTDAERASFGAYGSEATVTCYSGGQVVFETKSTGKVQALEADGFAFRDKNTGKFVRAFADCIISEG